jgi:hypothetical protein
VGDPHVGLVPSHQRASLAIEIQFAEWISLKVACVTAMASRGMRANSPRYRRGSGDRAGGRQQLQSIYDCRVVQDPGNLQTKPAPRSGHRIVADDSNLYSFGGYNPHGAHPHLGLYRELWRFNLATRKWSLLKSGDSCPEETASHSMLVLG